jgi:hypothetical protein
MLFEGHRQGIKSPSKKNITNVKQTFVMFFFEGDLIFLGLGTQSKAMAKCGLGTAVATVDSTQTPSERFGADCLRFGAVLGTFKPS